MRGDILGLESQVSGLKYLRSLCFMRPVACNLIRLTGQAAFPSGTSSAGFTFDRAEA